MAGTITQTLEAFPLEKIKVVTLECTAASDDGTFPSTPITTTFNLSGYHLIEVRTKPGATQPTDSYDIVFNDALGIDLMGGSLADRSASLAQSAFPQAAAGVYCPKAIISPTLTCVITNNAVHSAGITIKLIFMRG